MSLRFGGGEIFRVVSGRQIDGFCTGECRSWYHVQVYMVLFFDGVHEGHKVHQ